MEVKKITIPDGWEIDKIENGEITFKENKKEPHKKEFPKTWEDCILQVCDTEYIDENSTIQEGGGYGCCEEYAKKEIPAGLGNPLLALCQLLVCREVYRGGWKPDYDDKGWVYAVTVSNDGLINMAPFRFARRTLSFQSAEICNQFIKNFRDLIEEAKELI